MRAHLASAVGFGAAAALPLLLYVGVYARADGGPAPLESGLVVLGAVAAAALVGAAAGRRIAGAPNGLAAAVWGVGVTAAAVVTFAVGVLAVFEVLEPSEASPSASGVLSPELWSIVAATSLLLSPAGALGGVAVWWWMGHSEPA